jgi:hypothetical protein
MGFAASFTFTALLCRTALTPPFNPLCISPGLRTATLLLHVYIYFARAARRPCVHSQIPSAHLLVCFLKRVMPWDYPL